MKAAMKKLLAWVAFVVLAALSGACGSKIGDQCTQNLDCGFARLCDTSMPDGYCTVKSCRPGTCPDDSVCMRFYTTETYCIRPCKTNAACRDGYVCRVIDGASTGGCLPE